LLESIQSNTTTYLVYLDRRLRFAEVNAAYCRASGRPREELLGRSLSEVHTGPELEAALQKVLVRGEPAELHEVPEVARSGATVWWDWSVRPICDADDGIEGLVLSAMDVTEKVRTRAELESASRQKDEFLAMLAHELRNPLSAIASAMELVGADSTSTSMRARARDIASRQIDQMTRLLDDLLDVSRITSGRIRLERRRLDLRAVVEQAVEATMPLIGARRHELAIHLPDTPAMMDGDRHRLVQVVSNLLTNAAKYTPPEGHIEVEVRRADTHFELHVSDDGAGIAPEFLPHVFELFSQGSRTLDRTEGGLGIGLTVVSRLVKMHGGEVEAHSEGLGRGSEVVARFPAPVARAAADSAAETGGARQAPPKRILLVEDNADAADMLATLLELEGHEVTIAGDGPRGIEAAERDKPEIVVLDIGLPGIDGFEVARRLRERDLQPPPRIVGLSGYGGEHDRERAQQVGMDGYLVKPVDHAKLRHLLGEAPSSSVPPPS
jgi:PAS domain S-box-containing protein